MYETWQVTSMIFKLCLIEFAVKFSFNKLFPASAFMYIEVAQFNIYKTIKRFNFLSVMFLLLL